MFRYRFAFAVMLVVVAAAVFGCSDDQIVNPGTAVNPDEAALTSMMNSAVEFQHDVVSHTVPDTTVSLGTDMYFWWREYASTDRQFDFNITPADLANPNSLADVNITTTCTGTLHIVHRDASSVYTHTTKPLVDVFTQSASFEQLFSDTSTNRGWVLQTLSNPIGGSNPTSLSIQSVSLYPASSPTQNYYEASFANQHTTSSEPMFALDEQINVMMQSGNGTNDAFRHDYYSGGCAVQGLVNQDFGFYTDVMNTPASLTSAEASRAIVVDVLATGVIDGSADYDAIIWVIPYNVDLGGTPL